MSTKPIAELLKDWEAMKSVAPTAPVQPVVQINHAPGFDITPAVQEDESLDSLFGGPDVIPQPNVKFFESIALPLASRGWKVIPLCPKTKEVHTGLVPEPLRMATGDPEKIREWGQSEPNANVGVYAEQVPGGMLFLDKDGVADLAAKYEQETGNQFPKTLYVRSSTIDNGGGVIEKGHWYFLQSAKTLAANNISEASTGGLFSLRLRNEYVCSIGSVHPKTGLPYEIGDDCPVVPMPDVLFDWLESRRIEKPKTREAVKERGKFTKGTRYPSLISQAGKLWQQGFSRDMVITASIDWARENFDIPEDAFDEDLVKAEVTKIVDSYKQGDPASKIVLVDGHVAGSKSVGTVSVQFKPEIDRTGLASRPVFPLDAIKGTSLYEGFVRPIVESSSKNPEFLWLPAVQIFMNYLSDKVRIEYQTINWNLFIGLISDPGKYYKSSSCKLAQHYFKLMGLAQTYTPDIRNCEGRVIIMQAGSSEGFGLAMSKINSKHGLLFNDELGKLVAKIGIENSSMPSDILSWYERDDFANTITNRKTHFSFEANAYTFGMCWATTTQGFNRHWPRLAGVVSGMEDRMFFCIGPEEPRPLVAALDVPLQEAALRTRRIIDNVLQGVSIDGQAAYRYEDIEAAQRVFAKWGDPRSQGLLEKLALYLAIDLERPTIDADCLERANSLVTFRNGVIAYLAPIEADNAQARLQCEIDRELKRNGGEMTQRTLYRNLSGHRYGDEFWSKALLASLKAERLVAWEERGARGQKKKMIGIPKLESEE